VSTLTEIEAAIAKLPNDMFRELLRRMNERDAAEWDRRNGFGPLPNRCGSVVTVEAVRQLCDEEGV
jgi:hypothetical protein